MISAREQICPGTGPRVSIEMKGETYPMKKIIKTLAEYFALYGQHMTENMGL